MIGTAVADDTPVLLECRRESHGDQGEHVSNDSSIRRLAGANMDIDLATAAGAIAWRQDACPWNAAEGTSEHRCAVKNVSLCRYFRGVEYLDTLLCCYPQKSPDDLASA